MRKECCFYPETRKSGKTHLPKFSPIQAFSDSADRFLKSSPRFELTNAAAKANTAEAGDSRGSMPLEDEEPKTGLAHTGGQERTMSSMKITELCEKRHRDVMRNIRSTLNQVQIDEGKFAGSYMSANGADEIDLPKFRELTGSNGEAGIRLLKFKEES